MKVVGIGVADRAESTLTQGWRWIKDVSWLPDSSGLIINGRDDKRVAEALAAIRKAVPTAKLEPLPLNLATAEAQLGRLVGYAGRVRAADDSSYYHVLTQVDTAQLMATARTSAPQVVSGAATAEQARAQLGSVKASYWPQLALNGSWTFSGSSRTDPRFELFGQRQVSLGLSWPLFNKFVRERNVDNQAAQVSVAEANAGEAERQVHAELISQFATLDAAAVRIEVAQQSLAASREDIRVVGERYRLGVATLVDLLVSQEGLTQSELDMVNARLDYLRTKAQLEATLGRAL